MDKHLLIIIISSIAVAILISLLFLVPRPAKVWDFDTAQLANETASKYGNFSQQITWNIHVSPDGKIYALDGNQINKIKVDQQIRIRADLANPTTLNQTFAYIVQIQNKEGIVESLSWLSGMLAPSQAFSPSVSWVPSKAGNYTVNVFVWASIGNPDALSPPLSADLEVISNLTHKESKMISENFQCKSGYELVIKSSDNSMVCVKPETKSKLIARGWGTNSDLQTSGIVPNSFMNCQTPYPKTSDGIAVLYMPTNSIGKICVRYFNFNDMVTPVGIRIFEANNLTQNASEITTWASSDTIPNGNATIVYTIKTGDKTGFYGLSLFCGGMPFAVGHDSNSRIGADDFPWINKVFGCPAQKYESHIEGIDGIGIRYISHYSIFP